MSTDGKLPLLGGANIVDLKARQTNKDLKELLVRHVELKNRALEQLALSHGTLKAAGELLKECREVLAFRDETCFALAERITELIGD